MTSVADWFSTLLPGGIVAALGLSFRFVQSARKQREQSERKVVNSWRDYVDNLEANLADTKRDLDYKDTLVNYWRDRCQVREMSLASSTRKMTVDEINSYPPPPQPPPEKSKNHRQDEDDDQRPALPRRTRTYARTRRSDPDEFD